MRRFVCLLVLITPLLFAGDPAPKPAKTKPAEKVASQKKADQPKAQTGGGGYVVQIDGGGLVRNPDLTPDVQEALAEMINTSSEGLVQESLADGTVVVDLEGRFQSAMVATINKDGKAVGHCFSKDPKHKCGQHTQPKADKDPVKEK
ncbi:SPOR domain-containing protein [Acanthopleuribacter pedis]|uniref:Uncharacterized protein n=1 Tax=Acanthopleuribacter pedis TaxID=442870 RepID=A0A8J7QPN5_9BACT|nr:hypothetical protein [Acanthopleuribacter pedis]MBO1322358.1 hypothetical protein [Acanthopleuribacter pedis]